MGYGRDPSRTSKSSVGVVGPPGRKGEDRATRVVGRNGELRRPKPRSLPVTSYGASPLASSWRTVVQSNDAGRSVGYWICPTVVQRDRVDMSSVQPGPGLRGDWRILNV